MIQDGIEINPPPPPPPPSPTFTSKEKTFERWKTDIELRSEVTELTKGEMGIEVALSLPERYSTMICEQMMEEVPLADLIKKDDGFKTFFTFMEKKLGKLMIWKIALKSASKSTSMEIRN